MKRLLFTIPIIALLGCSATTEDVPFYNSGDRYLSTQQLETYGPFVITLSNGAKVRIVNATNSLDPDAPCVIDVQSLEAMMLANWEMFARNTAPIGMQAVARGDAVYCVGPGRGCIVEAATLPPIVQPTN